MMEGEREADDGGRETDDGGRERQMMEGEKGR